MKKVKFYTFAACAAIALQTALPAEAGFVPVPSVTKPAPETDPFNPYALECTGSVTCKGGPGTPPTCEATVSCKFLSPNYVDWYSYNGRPVGMGQPRPRPRR